MEKILFLVPMNIYYEDFIHPAYNARIVKKQNGDFTSVLTDMPLGIMSMSAYVKKHVQVEVKLVDFNLVLNYLERFEYKSFTELFRDTLGKLDFQPTIIGISSLFTPSYQNILDIAKCCRELFPGALIIAGGSVPTNLYREIYRDSSAFDALCYGEGEKPLLDLVRAEDKFEYLKKSPSWITRDKAASPDSLSHDFINDLDEIPFYDYALCDTERYAINPAITAYAGVQDKKQNFHVMTSRGCPHHCCFCSSHTVHGRAMRFYSLKRVKEDFLKLRDVYGAKTLVFQDDHFMADKKRALEILGFIREMHITAIFQNGIALYTLDREVLEAFKSAGIDQIVLAVESGSDKVLREIMHKPLNLNIVKKVADECRELGMYTDINILIGLPGETKQDIEDTRVFLKSIHANWFRIMVATPLVGSELLEICIKKNYVESGYIDCNYKKAVIGTEDFTAEWIQEKAYTLNLELNFIANGDVAMGDHKMALRGFEAAISAKNDHAIAYYCAARCYQALGDTAKARTYMRTAKEIIAKDPLWRKYAEMFDIKAAEY